jgi:small GTP-binding protein
LEDLNLNGNQLTELPPAIAQLSNLQSLNLNNNELTELPPAIAQLSNLQTLNLNNNELTELPPAIAQLTSLQRLSISGNKNLRLAPEIIEAGTEAILAYLSHVKDAPKEWVSKMLVVGEGAVGKTSLLRALREEEFVKGLVTTHGIETGTLQIAHPEFDGVTMNLNTWDFGGQQIYHATHQFFLTNRSLYVLVWNARMGFEQCKLNYWLDTIEARAPQSPIILVATHTDERKAGLPLKELQERYPQIVGHVEVSNRKGKGLDQLKQAIAEASASLPLMGERWPTEWAKVRDLLRKRRKRKKYIDPSEYDDLMAKYNVTGIEERVLTNWLHELGEIIYFREVDELKDTVILDSQWVTQAISQVLESEEVKKGLGLFTRQHMKELWRRIEAGMRDHMLKLMEQFDLSYRTLDNKEISIVVERLDFDPPADIEPKWECVAQPHNEISMKFSLDKTMPAGIPTWFIARQHRFTTYNHWRYGALFADEKKRHWGLVQAFPHDRYLRLIV